MAKPGAPGDDHHRQRARGQQERQRPRRQDAETLHGDAAEYGSHGGGRERERKRRKTEHGRPGYRCPDRVVPAFGGRKDPRRPYLRRGARGCGISDRPDAPHRANHRTDDRPSVGWKADRHHHASRLTADDGRRRRGSIRPAVDDRLRLGSIHPAVDGDRHPAIRPAAAGGHDRRANRPAADGRASRDRGDSTGRDTTPLRRRSWNNSTPDRSRSHNRRSNRSPDRSSRVPRRWSWFPCRNTHHRPNRCGRSRSRDRSSSPRAEGSRRGPAAGYASVAWAIPRRGGGYYAAPVRLNLR